MHRPSLFFHKVPRPSLSGSPPSVRRRSFSLRPEIFRFHPPLLRLFSHSTNQARDPGRSRLRDEESPVWICRSTFFLCYSRHNFREFAQRNSVIPTFRISDYVPEQIKEDRASNFFDFFGRLSPLASQGIGLVEDRRDWRCSSRDGRGTSKSIRCFGLMRGKLTPRRHRSSSLRPLRHSKEME